MYIVHSQTMSKGNKELNLYVYTYKHCIFQDIKSQQIHVHCKPTHVCSIYIYTLYISRHRSQQIHVHCKSTHAY